VEFGSFDFGRVERGDHFNDLFNQRFGDTDVVVRWHISIGLQLGFLDSFVDFLPGVDERFNPVFW
jgi:hypothetical protein